MFNEGASRPTQSHQYDLVSLRAGWDDAQWNFQNPPVDMDDVDTDSMMTVRTDEMVHIHRARNAIIAAANGKRLPTPRYLQLIREHGMDHFQCGPHLMVCTRNHRFAIALIDHCANGQIVGDVV